MLLAPSLIGGSVISMQAELLLTPSHEVLECCTISGCCASSFAVLGELATLQLKPNFLQAKSILMPGGMYM